MSTLIFQNVKDAHEFFIGFLEIQTILFKF